MRTSSKAGMATAILVSMGGLYAFGRSRGGRFTTVVDSTIVALGVGISGFAIGIAALPDNLRKAKAERESLKAEKAAESKDDPVPETPAGTTDTKDGAGTKSESKPKSGSNVADSTTSPGATTN